MEYKYGSLYWTIYNNIKITESRKNKVIDILRDNQIQTYQDLKGNPIPRKGLTANEIRQLQTIKDNYKTISRLEERSCDILRKAIGKYASKHEESRIFNLLKDNGILSVRILYSTPNATLKKIYGIGSKSMYILQCVKSDFINKSTKTFIGKSLSETPFQPLLASLAA